jgi:hypothetical protein
MVACRSGAWARPDPALAFPTNWVICRSLAVGHYETAALYDSLMFSLPYKSRDNMKVSEQQWLTRAFTFARVDEDKNQQLLDPSLACLKPANAA